MTTTQSPNRAAEAHESQKARERVMEKARKKYGQKDFLDRQRNLYDVAGMTLMLLHVLSVVFALPLCIFLFYQVIVGKELATDAMDQLFAGSAQAGMATAVILALAVLFGLEWIKSTTLQTFFEIRFAENHTPKGMLVIVVLLVGASILTSVKGGDVLGAVRTEAPELADESAIVSRFDAQIAAERQHQQSIRDGRTHKWKGALTPQGAKELAASGKRLEKLLEQQEAEMLNARVGNAGAQMATASKSFANSKWFMGLALVVDLGILIAIFYRERFEYLTVALVTTGSAQPRPVSGISVGPGGVTLYGNPAQAPPDMPNRNAIGFQRQQAPVNPGLTTQVEHGQQSGGSFEDVVKAAEAAHLDSTYLSRYRPAVEVFLAGGSKMEAARAANCSRSTAHTVKQIMRQLKLIPEPQAQD